MTQPAPEDDERTEAVVTVAAELMDLNPEMNSDYAIALAEMIVDWKLS